MKDAQNKNKSLIKITSVAKMIEFIGENEMHYIHNRVVPGLSRDFLKRWETLESEDPTIKKFIIFNPEQAKNEDSKYKIYSMLSGEVKTTDDNKKIYTILNTFTIDTKNRNASNLILELAKIAGEGNRFQGCLNLKLKVDGEIMKLGKEGKEELVSKLNGKFRISDKGIEFDEGIDVNPEFIDELKNAELWKNINFKFFNSFSKTPNMTLRLEVGGSGNINLMPSISINQEVIQFTEKRLAEKSESSGSSERSETLVTNPTGSLFSEVREGSPPR